MIFQNSDINSLPDSKAIGKMLAMLQSEMPVRHMMPLDRVVADEDDYILTRLASGRFSIKPNITHQGLLYYGNCDFENLKNGFIPSYYKARDGESNAEHDDFLEYNVLIEQFRLLIESFPLYKLLRDGIEVDGRLTIRMENPGGLASAYKLKAPFVNLTSDFDVAMFYATHSYDEATRTFKNAEVDKVGVVYTFGLALPFGLTPGLSTLGKLVFPRALNNRQFLYALSKDKDFNQNKLVNAFTFRQTEEGSDLYGDMFNGGEDLLPKDDFLKDKWDSLGKSIYRMAIENNWKSNPHDDFEYNCRILEDRKFVLKEGMPKFTYEDIASLDLLKIWNQLFDDLVANDRYKCDVVDFLAQVPYMDKYKFYFNANLYYER